MSNNNEIINFSNDEVVGIDNKVNFSNMRINDITRVDEWLFIVFDNDKKILLDQKNNKVYDISDYYSFINAYEMDDKVYAVLRNGLALDFVLLENMEVVFEDKSASRIFKEDDRVLNIHMKVGAGDNKLYDIKTKKYLPVPQDYKYEHSLGNNLYVFSKKGPSDEFYDSKRCVINADGETLVKDIEGWVELNDNCLIVHKKSKLGIIPLQQDSSELKMKIIEKNDNIIADPQCYKGNILLVEKGSVKLLSPSLKLLQKFDVDCLVEVVDSEWVGDTLKLAIPYTKDAKQLNRHVYVDLINGNVINHLRIDGYPYWNPTTYVGYDCLDKDKISSFYFYDKDFNETFVVSVNECRCLDSKNSTIFSAYSKNDMGIKRQLINVASGVIKEIDYDMINFSPVRAGGYGVKFDEGTMDFFDDDFNIVFGGFDFKKFNLKVQYGDFAYFIINDYLQIKYSFMDGTGLNRTRSIIQKNGTDEAILDSLHHTCYPIGDFIQIVNNYKSEFLNTLTGEIGPLSINVPVDENDNIYVGAISSANYLLSNGSINSSSDINPKIKQLTSNKKDNYELPH